MQSCGKFLGITLLLLLGSVFTHAQIVRINFKAVESGIGGKLNGVQVKLFCNDSLVDSSAVAGKGKSEYTLKPNYTYQLKFSKQGYEPKFVEVNTSDIPPKFKDKKFTIKIEMNLFQKMEGLEVDFLKTEPVGKSRFNIEEEAFRWDFEYSRLMRGKVLKATLEYTEKQK
jgi:hypothetical protein